MKSLRLKPVRVTIADEAALTAVARTLAQKDSQIAADEALRWISFGLGPHRCALDLALLNRAVARLGDVTPLLGASPRIQGVAFVDNVPHVVADLREAIGAPARARLALRDAPALVVAREGWRIAVSVDGPLDLAEGGLVRAAEAIDLGGRAEIAGTHASGAMVLGSGWFRGWVEELAAR